MAFYLHRYVDDTFLLSSEAEAEIIRKAFEQNSILKFTIEHEKGKTLPFLDVELHRNNSITTCQYRKPTASDQYLNYNSYTADKYKISLIKTLLYRIFRLNTNDFDRKNEIIGLKKFLPYKNY